ncbi:MAG TPA: pirin family protein [Thermoanaerobaculia bacterium]|nr:pirin family protein [Thermoanaerobaculia bacterium]
MRTAKESFVRSAAVTAPPVDRGMNPRHRVRRIIEPGEAPKLDPFLMLAEDWFMPGTFGDHPHRGFETVTLVLEGGVEHRDDRGGHGVLEPGDAQWMTAGRGVVHSEEAAPEGAHTLQLWLNLPSGLKMTEPSYQDLRGEQMPERREEGARIRVFAGEAWGVRGPARTLHPVTMLEIWLEPEASIGLGLPGDDTAFLYVIEGSGRFGAEGAMAGAGERVVFERGPQGASSSVIAFADGPLHAVFWSGSPIREPIAAGGPFVMNTREELLQAFADYSQRRF